MKNEQKKKDRKSRTSSKTYYSDTRRIFISLLGLSWGVAKIFPWGEAKYPFQNFGHVV